MEIEPEQVDEFLRGAELVALGQTKVGDILYIQIDPAAEGLSNFYTWGEIPPGTIPAKEVWRSFLWLDESEQLWGVNAYLKDISLSASHTVGSVLQSICSV